MPLVDNINILKEHCYTLWKQLEQYKQQQKFNSNLISLEDSRKGAKTLVATADGRRTYLHSKYDPIREADVIIDGCGDINDDTTVVFYGTGLGYHIVELVQRYPNVDFYIYEPVPEIFAQYISHGELHKLPLRRLKGIVLADTEQQAVSFFNSLLDHLNSNMVIVELPSHKTAFPQEYQQFQTLFKNIVKGKRNKLHVDYAFQKRWIINSMKNFKEVLSTPNILMEKKGVFVGQPALLVAAGPSLNEEIEHIRYIKDNGLAYIFSVGSAINTLVENNIYPHAACTYDPTVHNQKVFTKVVERDITDIPMIFGSSVGYETLENYPGPKYHMLTSQDTVANYFLKSKDGQVIDGVYDAPTIAVVTLQLLYQLGFNPIILVGQNLAFKDKKRHSAGVDYSTDVTEQEMEHDLWVKDVHGQEVLTNEGFNSMRQQMESYIKQLSGINVLNTTQGGAVIQGAPFIPLAEVLKKHLKEKECTDDWLAMGNFSYDIGYLINQTAKMNEAYTSLQSIMPQVSRQLNKIKTLAANGNYNQLETMYSKLDDTVQKMQENDYFKVFIKPMNRVYYDILSKETIDIREEKEPRIKADKVVKSFERFLRACREDLSGVNDVYEEIKKAITSLGR